MNLYHRLYRGVTFSLSQDFVPLVLIINYVYCSPETFHFLVFCHQNKVFLLGCLYHLHSKTFISFISLNNYVCFKKVSYEIFYLHHRSLKPIADYFLLFILNFLYMCILKIIIQLEMNSSLRNCKCRVPFNSFTSEIS